MPRVSDKAARDPSATGDRELGFDELLDRLRAVVGRLETGNLGLEDSLKAYEEGVSLARRGHELLDRTEKRVELLVREVRGAVETRPLEGSATDEPS
jgi:exodeoxyribonuclease VII small subunit